MKRLLAVLALSFALAICLVPSMALAASESDLTAAEAVDALAALTAQASTPKIAVKRAATGKVAVKVGKTYKLGAKATSGKLSYKSSNKKVAKVSSKGTVRAIRAGKTTITVTAKNGSKKATKKVSVKVLPAKKYKAVKKIKAKASA